MVNAPVSPIATQETEVSALADALVAYLRQAAGLVESGPVAVATLIHAERSAIERYEKAERALSSAERRIEELVRERDTAQHGWATVLGDVAAQIKTVTTLKAEVEELKRERDEALTEHTDMMWQRRRADERAESALASLTGQVEDMRERAAKVADDVAERYDVFEQDKAAMTAATVYAHFRVAISAKATAARIRSLPVLPTTGDGGEDDADLPDPSEVRGILKPTGRETSGEET